MGYGNDHAGALPAVAMRAGSPWWKVGSSGKENQSNTRHVWLLVKNDYVDAENFICPGNKNARVTELSSEAIQKLNDFPTRQNISYSYTFMCNKMAKRPRTAKTVLMADLNPVFEKVFDRDTGVQQKRDEFTTLWISEQLRKVTSMNHKDRGQNVLLGDSSVKFTKSRMMSDDDIYTVRGINVYTGREVPCDEKDTFLAP